MPPLHRYLRARVSGRVSAAAASDPAGAIEAMRSSPTGLSADEAARRLAADGPNRLQPNERGGGGLFLRAVGNPLVVLLAILSGSSFLSGDLAAASLMASMMAIGVGLRFVQESRADAAAAALRAMIRIHATVVRDGAAAEIPIGEIVRGDIIHLAAGDMVPADVRILFCKDLFVTQAVLTGESFPVEKFAAADHDPTRPPLDLSCIAYLGTSVASGTAEAVVLETGRTTFLGSVAATLEVPEPPTAFDLGMQRFTWMMVALAAVMTAVVVLINGLVKGDWWEAFLFGLAVAVGITPEMLPMIVAVCLSRGAVAMAGRKVIVKHIDSIQNLGAMDLLCTDKTGTLTQDRIILQRHCDVALREDPGVLRLAWLNSHFQTGLRNLLDRAVLDRGEAEATGLPEGVVKLDEIPFDFSRRLMSVVVASDHRRRLICKGAPDAIFSRCRAYELDGRTHPIDGAVPEPIVRECEKLSAEGFRVLAVAFRDVEAKPAYGREDERDLVLRGYLTFLDPPKDSAGDAIAALVGGGVRVKVLTGDEELVSRTICAAVGLDSGTVLRGEQVDCMEDAELSAAAGEATLLVRLTPMQKQRVVRLLKSRGHVVGFLGDGVNDAPALREADVGLTVDTAVDLARESADCILLDKDLRVLWDGVREGRKVFTNVVKYIRMGASSNFGNMLSMLAASCLLPYLPMTPLQILTNNLLYDCSQVPIPGDTVDEESILRPRPWSMRRIARFILLVGPCSSIFDLTTFVILLTLFGCTDPARAPLFHTAWFVESLVTQTLVIHVIRTSRIPFLESHASLALTAATAAVVMTGIWLPESPVAPLLGFVPLPGSFWILLVATAAAYGAVVHGVTRWLDRRGWID
ncbi:MAG: magnesium-translocating P-type ATPase [Planctomycetia bacterium]